jgi:cytidylate kinase
MSDPAPVIAIDGPAASGKGTVAEGAARVLGFRYLDSGALYRLVALKTMRSDAAVSGQADLAALADTLDVSFDAGRIHLDGGDVTEAIRDEEVGVAASRVAVDAGLRRALLQRQRAFRRPPGLIAEGRDMGTVVFPDARLKIFVTATAEERARRRHKQLIENGKPAILDGLLRDIRERDARDSTREVAPLRPASDATILDTTDMSIDAAIAFVVQRYQSLGQARGI